MLWTGSATTKGVRSCAAVGPARANVAARAVPSSLRLVSFMCGLPAALGGQRWTTRRLPRSGAGRRDRAGALEASQELPFEPDDGAIKQHRQGGEDRDPGPDQSDVVGRASIEDD